MNPSWPIARVLHKARWAPSGDNEQPWRFTADTSHSATVHWQGADPPAIYDFKGRASQIALGTLTETAAIAATEFGCQLRSHALDTQGRLAPGPVMRWTLEGVPQMPADLLAASIETRSVQRRALSSRALAREHCQQLEQEAALHDPVELVWMSSWSQRLRMARLLGQNALIRLTAPEAYRTHRDAIAWGQQFSEDRIPDRSLGLDPLTLLTMRWAMRSWKRVDFMNRYAAGTWLARLQLDWWPAVRCGAHFMLLLPTRPTHAHDYLQAGRSIQRLWLAAESLGLRLQPEFTPLVFDWHVREGVAFSSTPGVQQRVERLSQHLRTLWSDDVMDRAVFIGRIGYGPRAASRSLRRPLADLRPHEGRVP